MKFKYILAALVIFCWFYSGFADNLSFRSYGLEFGLTDNAIQDIAEDKYGFIWVATNEGLNRVSGNHIVKYYKGLGQQGLPGNELNCLLDEPEKSTMWIGTQRDGIVAFNYDTGETTYYRNISTEPASLVTNDITDMTFDPKGNLWVATYSNGIDFLDRNTGKFTHHKDDNVEGMVNNKFWCLKYDEKTGTILGGHVDAGFSVIDPTNRIAKNYSVKDGLAANEVWDMSVDTNYIWIATGKGLSRFNRNNGDIVNFTQPGYSNTVRSLKDMGSELLLTMDNQGVVEFDKQTHTFTTLTPRYILSPDNYNNILERSNPNKLFVDSYGNIIVGSLHEGLMAFSRDTDGFLINHISPNRANGDKALIYPDVRTISAGNHKIWFGSNGGGLSGLEFPSYSPDAILATHYDETGKLWVVGNDGNLIEYNPESETIKTHRLNLPVHREISLASYRDSLYIGTIEGVFVFDKRKGEKKRQFDVERNFIFCLATDSMGNIWVGSYGNGASLLDDRGNLIYEYTRKNGMVSNTVNDIYIENKNVWLATGEGLVRVDADSIGKFEVVADSMRSVKSVIADKGGNIWYANGSGIGVMRKNGEKFFFERQVPLSDFNKGAAAIDEDGKIYFGSSHGVVSFSPEYILSGNWLPMPRLAELIVNGGKSGNKSLIISDKNKVRLNYNQNNFTVIVTPSDFFVENYVYEYRLLGLDDRWYSMRDNNAVTFRDLPYGSYEFQVRNAAMEGYSKEKMDSLKITIIPPLWLQWWAKLIYTLIAIAICVNVIIWYRNRLRRAANQKLGGELLANQQLIQEERVKFFTNVTHELRTPLTLINGPLEDLLKGGSLSKSDYWKVDMVHKNAGRLLNLVNQLLDFRKTETNNKRLCVSYGDIVSFVKEVAMKYVELNRNPNVTISVEDSSEEVPMYFDKEVITIILDNLISNSMKYTERGIISVLVTQEEREDGRYVTISVKDSGHGIGKEALPHVFDRYYQENGTHQASGTGIGLALVKALVELHKGEISVGSVKDVGTNFVVTLKRDFDYPDAIHIAQEENNGNVTPTEEGIDENQKFTETEQNDAIEVLVVEDNADIMEYIKESLSGVFEVLTATNGRQGFEIAKKEVPDIIVTDVMMPVMNGLDMTRLIKNDVITSHIPVVMLTAKDSQSAREEGYVAGVDSYLTKPFSVSLLVARINNIISRRHMLTEYFKSNEYVSMRDNANDSPKDKDVNNRSISSEEMSRDREKLLSSLGKIDREFVEKIDRLILKGIENGDSVNIDYLIEGVYMSRPTLYRKMKAVTGMSANEYIRMVKISRAKELLLEGRLSLNEIAETTGFNSIGYFRESFKAVLGVTPGDYLKTLKSGLSN